MDLSAFKFSVPIEIRFADLDAFGHVNNAVYLTYFETARTHYWREQIHWDWKEAGVRVARAEITYLKPLSLGQKLTAYVRASRLGTSSFDIEYALVLEDENGSEVISTTGKTVCVAVDPHSGRSRPIGAVPRQNMQADLIG